MFALCNCGKCCRRQSCLSDPCLPSHALLRTFVTAPLLEQTHPRLSMLQLSHWRPTCEEVVHLHRGILRIRDNVLPNVGSQHNS